jgi:hypothetical protein
MGSSGRLTLTQVITERAFRCSSDELARAFPPAGSADAPNRQDAGNCDERAYPRDGVQRSVIAAAERENGRRHRRSDSGGQCTGDVQDPQILGAVITQSLSIPSFRSLLSDAQRHPRLDG